jgi:hypothetical protein
MLVTFSSDSSAESIGFVANYSSPAVSNQSTTLTQVRSREEGFEVGDILVIREDNAAPNMPAVAIAAPVLALVCLAVATWQLWRCHQARPPKDSADRLESLVDRSQSDVLDSCDAARDTELRFPVPEVLLEIDRSEVADTMALPVMQPEVAIAVFEVCLDDTLLGTYPSPPKPPEPLVDWSLYAQMLARGVTPPSTPTPGCQCQCEPCVHGPESPPILFRLI